VSAICIVFVMQQDDSADMSIDTEQAELVLQLENHLYMVPDNLLCAEMNKGDLNMPDDPIKGLSEPEPFVHWRFKFPILSITRVFDRKDYGP
jgi:hypothetical protein